MLSDTGVAWEGPAVSLLPPTIRELIEADALYAVFQPIISLRNGEILGYEGLIRSRHPAATHPAALFALAHAEGQLAVLNAACLRTIVEAFAKRRLAGRLFVNVSPEALKLESPATDRLLEYLSDLGLEPGRIVIEVTESQPIAGVTSIFRSIQKLQAMGCEVAVDDLGEGYASLRLWSELRPDFVKIDRHFVSNVHRDPVKFQMVRAIRQLSDLFGTKVIGEGVELDHELRVLRDLSVEFAQGYLIEVPTVTPFEVLPEHIVAHFEDRSAERRGSDTPAVGMSTLERLAQPIVPVRRDETGQAVYERFIAESALQAIPVVEHGLPVGLLRRDQVIHEFTRPYRKEVFARRACAALMDDSPLIVDASLSVQDASILLVEGDSRFMIAGMVVTRHGRYLGYVGGQDVVREITQYQMRAARYANPLTLLPGNVPIAEKIQLLLAQHVPFQVCYCDIDNFKAYNDTYGYQRGDDLLGFTARVFSRNTVDPIDFVGHIGGDDFVLVLRSRDWVERCEVMLREFDAGMPEFVSHEHRVAGGYYAEDRRGNEVFHALPTLSIGAVIIDPGRYLTHYEVADRTAAAKKEAKKRPGSALFIEARRT